MPPTMAQKDEVYIVHHARAVRYSNHSGCLTVPSRSGSPGALFPVE